MQSRIGWAGALAYTGCIVVAIMTPLLILPLALSMALPSVELTDNWTVLRVVSACLAWFVAGMTVSPIVGALGLSLRSIRHPAVITWTRRVLEFALLVAFYALFVTPTWAVLLSAVVATVFFALAEPHLDKILSTDKDDNRD